MSIEFVSAGKAKHRPAGSLHNLKEKTSEVLQICNCHCTLVLHSVTWHEVLSQQLLLLSLKHIFCRLFRNQPLQHQISYTSQEAWLLTDLTFLMLEAFYFKFCILTLTCNLEALNQQTPQWHRGNASLTVSSSLLLAALCWWVQTTAVVVSCSKRFANPWITLCLTASNL